MSETKCNRNNVLLLETFTEKSSCYRLISKNAYTISVNLHSNFNNFPNLKQLFSTDDIDHINVYVFGGLSFTQNTISKHHEFRGIS